MARIREAKRKAEKVNRVDLSVRKDSAGPATWVKIPMADEGNGQRGLPPGVEVSAGGRGGERQHFQLLRSISDFLFSSDFFDSAAATP